MCKPRVLVLGGSGCLGSAIIHELSFSGNDYLGTYSTSLINNQADIQQFRVGENIETLLSRVKPNIVINCIVNKKSGHFVPKHTKELFRTNTYFPLRLAKVSSIFNVRVIHISTNAVFSGIKGLHRESSLPFPKTLYSSSKLLGESKLENVSNIRVSFVPKNLETAIRYNAIDWLTKASNDIPALGFENHFWNGLTEQTVAKLLCAVINNSFILETLPHTLHLFSSKQMSKYEMCALLLKKYNLPSNYLRVSKSPKFQNLTLDSDYRDYLQLIWQEAGFNEIPSFHDLF